jgi:hypothetical protein
MTGEHHEALIGVQLLRQTLDEGASTALGVVGVVNDEGAAFAGEGVDESVDRPGSVLADPSHRGGGFGETRVRHGGAQPRSKELCGHAALVQDDLDCDRAPHVDQLGAEDGLAVAGAGLDNDDICLEALRGQPRPSNVVRRQTAQFTAPRPVPSASFVVGSLREVYEPFPPAAGVCRSCDGSGR